MKRNNVQPLADWECPGGFGYVRVSGCEADQVLDLAFASGLDEEQCHVLERGWFHCSPCICGEHRYDLNPAEPWWRGAFYAYVVGSRRS